MTEKKMLAGIIPAAIGGIVSIFTSIFQTKAQAATAVVNGIAEGASVMKQVDATDGVIATAASATIVSENQSESILTRNWRALTMLSILSLIAAWMWGYTPPNINGVMPPVIGRLFDLLELGVCGYIGGRTAEKIARIFMTPKIIDAITRKLGGQ